MNTEDRQYVRDFAYTMEATFRDDPKGLKLAQQDARRAITYFHKSFPNETDDTLCVVARAITVLAARLAHSPPRELASALHTLIDAYPLAAGALAGVYILPEAEDEKGEKPGDNPAPPAVFRDENVGQYL